MERVIIDHFEYRLSVITEQVEIYSCPRTSRDINGLPPSTTPPSSNVLNTSLIELAFIVSGFCSERSSLYSPPSSPKPGIETYKSYILPTNPKTRAEHTRQTLRNPPHSIRRSFLSFQVNPTSPLLTSLNPTPSPTIPPTRPTSPSICLPSRCPELTPRIMSAPLKRH